MSTALKRILNSKVKIKQFTGRIQKRNGNRYVVSTNSGTILANYNPAYAIGDNVVVLDMNIISKSGLSGKIPEATV